MSLKANIPNPGYELTFITRPEMPDAALKTFNEKLAGIILKYEGEIILSDNWGKKKMSYPIKKETRGNYTHLVYHGKSGIAAEVERNLRMHEHVLRFLTVNVAKEFDKEKYLKDLAIFKTKKEEAEAARIERAEHHREFRESRDGGSRH